MTTIVPNTYVVYRAESPLQIDGRLNEPSWKRAPWTPFFVDIEGTCAPCRASPPGP